MSGSPTRVCYASGTWQLIALCAALRAHYQRFPDAADTETVVVFSGTGTVPALRETLEGLAGLYDELHRFVWIDDLLAGLQRLHDGEFDAAIEAVRERIGVASAVEVWVNYPWFGTDRFLLGSYPDARVMLFEDGILTVEAARPLLKWPWLDVADLIHAHVPTLASVLASTASGDPRRSITA